MSSDPYVLAHQLLSVDVSSVSLSELAILEYACTVLLDLVNKEFVDRGYVE